MPSVEPNLLPAPSVTMKRTSGGIALRPSQNQKREIFHDTTKEIIERNEKLARDIFEHKLHKKTLIPIPTKEKRKLFKDLNKKSFDDTEIDLKFVNDIHLTQTICEGLMKLVFEESLEQGFFGLMGGSKRSSKKTKLTADPNFYGTRIERSKKSAPVRKQIELPQQQETRKDVVVKRNTTERRKWLIDIESRIQPNEIIKVLIVDDTESDRMILGEMVQEEYLNPIIDYASNGLEAYEKVNSNYFNFRRYDMIFMDMNMAEHDGRAGITMIRGFEKRNKITKPCNICAVSGDDFEEVKGEEDFNLMIKVKKPIEMELLRRILKKAAPSCTAMSGLASPVTSQIDIK